MGAMRACPCAEHGEEPLHGTQVFEDLPQPSAGLLMLRDFSLSGRLIHSYPSNHSGRICWVGVYQPKNYPLGVLPDTRRPIHLLPLSFTVSLGFSLSGLLKSYVLGPVPGTGVTGQWGCQGPALSGSMGQVLMRHCGPMDAIGC